jgi:hypothetical protein
MLAIVPQWRRPKYGLLGYRRSGNLGDELQSLAARRFLPYIDCVIDRETMNAEPWFDRSEVQIILNGWFTHRPENWPPSPRLTPLITSFHLSDEIHPQNQRRISAAKVLVEGSNLEYLKKHAPIGARDLGTRDLLERHGVESKFSACLTLTLERPREVMPGDYVCVNDVDAEILAAVRSRTRAPVRQTTHRDRLTIGSRRRMRKADALLRLYAGAKCVITSRLHCALPCLAVGTPVLLVMLRPDTYRFSGLLSLLRHCSREEFLASRVDFNFDRPAPNPTDHLSYRDRLVASCEEFIAGTRNAVQEPAGATS